jgi:hypothetical protein
MNFVTARKMKNFVPFYQFNKGDSQMLSITQVTKISGRNIFFADGTVVCDIRYFNQQQPVVG